MNKINNPVIIFGAGAGAEKVVKILENLKILIFALVDNNEKKWGEYFNKIPILSPTILNENDYNIIIASDYQEEIEEQLINMGFLNRLVLREEYIMQYFDKNFTEFVEKMEVGYTKEISEVQQRVIVIDLLECTEFGGIESWSFMLARGLQDKGYPIKILGDKDNIRITEDLEDVLVNIPVSYDNYVDSVVGIANNMIANLPSTIIINRQGQTLIAAILVKRLFPDHVRILSVIHTDRIFLYRRQAYLNVYTDEIIGVSKTIINKFNKQFSIQLEKLHFKESPVEYVDNSSEKTVVSNLLPIQIGYAARITKAQKRADLLPDLIHLLEKKHINYEMNIVGEGSYLGELRRRILEEDLEQRVHIMGIIPQDAMVKFWKSQNVFINISEFEGTSLSMLEAMSYGVVPIVTRVSGVDDIIINGDNGYICEQHDLKEMCTRLVALDRNRMQIVDMSNKAKETIKNKCNKYDYFDFIEKIL